MTAFADAIPVQVLHMPRPVVASYCVTFLAPEMLHVYRQITGLQSFHPHVLTQKWIHRDRFPFPEESVTVVPKSPWRALRRIWFKQVLDAPIPVSTIQTRQILETLTQTDARLLHVYFGHMGPVLLPVIRSAPVPVIVSFHGADAGVDQGRSRHAQAVREVFQLAALILVRSEALGDELVRLGCPQEKIRLNRTGIPMAEWPAVERVPPEDGAWQLFQACRLIEKKGLDVTLRAFARFRDAHPLARLTIAGEGPLLETLQRQVGELNLTDSVQFPGFLDQSALRATVESSHLFLHPSRTAADGNQEGVPNSMLEAMASGLPVIATRHGGIPEAIVHETSGLLIAEDDEDDLLRQMEKVTSDAGLYEKIATGARAAVLEKFSQQAQIEALEACYREVLQ